LAKTNALLQVELTRGEIRKEEIPAEVEKSFVGGRGLGTYLISSLPPGTPPLQRAAGIALCTGPLAGLGLPGTARVTLSAKSPLTGTVLDSNAGSAVALMLAGQGLRAVLLQGKAQEPSYLLIEDSQGKLLPARELWGKTTGETFERLREWHPSAGVVAIGPAGEKGVRFANVICADYGAFGRGGLGAVLGSKNIKALVFAPSKGPSAVKSVARGWRERIRALPLLKYGLSKHGTVPLLELMDQLGMLSSSTHTDKSRVTAGIKPLQTVSYGCGGCPVLCKRRSKKDDAPLKYQSLWAMGTQGGEFSIESAQQAAALCDELGMDAISAGGTLGCARLLDKRALLKEELRGIGGEELPALLEKIACREGAWGELAEGSRRFAAVCGDEDAAMVVKGMELPGFDPRGVPELALSYATSNRGACHSRGVAPLEAIKDSFGSQADAGAVARRVIEGQDWEAAMDSLMVCRFVAEALGKEGVGSLCTAALERQVDIEELGLLGARIWNLERCYNLSAGIAPSEDCLPSALTPDLREREELEELLREYYELRGWSSEGKPGRALMEKLGLSEWARKG